jgi:nucleotide-binding universal stress UspA family protein
MQFNKILCPVDLTEESKSAIALALDLARTRDGTLYLVHVVDDAFPYPDIFAVTRPGEDFYRTIRKEAEAQMRSMAEDQDLGGVLVETAVLQGRPASEVVAFAADKEVDVIVLSTLARRGLDRMLLGSQAERILRNAPCPVLSFKPALKD